MIVTYIIEGTLPGMNEIIAEARKHPMASANQKKTYTLLCKLSCLRVKKIRQPVNITLRWTEKNKRRDPDNIRAGAKFIFDGLVQAGVLEDDRRGNILSIMDVFEEPDAKNPRVVVEISY